jgi:hypothetical protein
MTACGETNSDHGSARTRESGRAPPWHAPQLQRATWYVEERYHECPIVHKAPAVRDSKNLYACTCGVREDLTAA